MQIRPPPSWPPTVSRQIAVFPVKRSPMISSRWPRPIGIMASTALIPVCTGLFTLWRITTLGAMRSTGRALSDLMGPLPSSGWAPGAPGRAQGAPPDRAPDVLPVVLVGAPGEARQPGRPLPLLLQPIGGKRRQRVHRLLEALQPLLPYLGQRPPCARLPLPLVPFVHSLFASGRRHLLRPAAGGGLEIGGGPRPPR